jgi:hypothetical protein
VIFGQLKLHIPLQVNLVFPFQTISYCIHQFIHELEQYFSSINLMTCCFFAHYGYLIYLYRNVHELHVLLSIYSLYISMDQI